MEYYEVSFKYESPVETGIINDILASELGNIGFESFVPEENGLVAYVITKKYDGSLLDECLANFPLPGITFHHTHKLIEERNWNEEWEKNYFQPIRIGKECLIRASFHPEEKGFSYPIVIDPKMAFGTGNHATTYLMLCEMLKLDLKDKEVLDMGCGTAVLAILAAMKDALRIVAIDIDKWAYDNAIENCRLNNTENIEIALGGAEQINRFGTFDFIFANINRNILLEDIRYYVPALKPEGSLYMSGFYKEDIPVIEKECNQHGFFLYSFAEQDNWVAVLVKRSIKSDIL
ncbi:MAG: 50S ribosomal protein L11 methyltransferase [Tannerella sp.]|jgi:ribosomal protein L11 methyltransferase|nr:50S ribosomal protein L11 methyltransferase [Tannerella sp.]